MFKTTVYCPKMKNITVILTLKSTDNIFIIVDIQGTRCQFYKRRDSESAKWYRRHENTVLPWMTFNFRKHQTTETDQSESNFQIN